MNFLVHNWISVFSVEFKFMFVLCGCPYSSLNETQKLADDDVSSFYVPGLEVIGGRGVEEDCREMSSGHHKSAWEGGAALVQSD